MTDEDWERQRAVVTEASQAVAALLRDAADLGASDGSVVARALALFEAQGFRRSASLDDGRVLPVAALSLAAGPCDLRTHSDLCRLAARCAPGLAGLLTASARQHAVDIGLLVTWRHQSSTKSHHVVELATADLEPTLRDVLPRRLSTVVQLASRLPRDVFDAVVRDATAEDPTYAENLMTAPEWTIQRTQPVAHAAQAAP